MNVSETLISILFTGTAYAMVLYIISVGLSITMGLLGIASRTALLPSHHSGFWDSCIPRPLFLFSAFLGVLRGQ